MTGFGVWKRARVWLAAAVIVPAIAAAQTTPSGTPTPSGSPPADSSLGRFSLQPSPRPSTPLSLPTSGPIIAPFNRPTPSAPVIVTPTPAPSASPTRTPTPTPSRSYGADAIAGVVNVVTKRETTGAAPSPTPTPLASGTPVPTASSAPAASATPEAAATPATADQPSKGLSTGLLIAIGAAALALVAFGGFLFGRQRGARTEAVVEPTAPTSVLEPIAVPPEPSSSHVTIPTRRRGADEPQPRLEITLIPKRAGTNLMGAAVDYRVVIRNTGTVAARDIRFAMYMLSASARQAQDLQMIFATTIEQPVVAPFELAPDQQMDLSGMAMLERERINIMTIEGRPWFVPVLAMKADYRWGENVGAPGVATAAHMIGIDRGEGAKMSPFRLDEGPHMHPEVAERKVA